MCETLEESSVLTHHKIYKVLKHESKYGFCYEVSKKWSSEKDISLDDELTIGMWQGSTEKYKRYQLKTSLIHRERIQETYL